MTGIEHLMKHSNPKRSASRAKQAPKAKLTAKTADRHDLYQRSVQDVESEAEFLERAFRKATKRSVQSLREDFCGTALLCSQWVQRGDKRTALGIDLDEEVLAWGVTNNLLPNGEPGNRVQLLCQDVREPVPGTYDIVAAMNFSYWIFKTREELRRYFRTVRESLQPDGILALDAYGGWESEQPMLEPRKIRGGFTYVWDQDSFCPITHHVTNHIHFEFRDGSRMDKAFTYEWRYWTLPELQELLSEAGYSEVRVYWDTASDTEDCHYQIRRRADNQPGWLAYLIAKR